MLASYTSLASAGRSSESPFQLSRANLPGVYGLKPPFMKERMLLENPAAKSTGCCCTTGLAGFGGLGGPGDVVAARDPGQAL